MSDWHVYILRCRGGTLYTGIATDVSRRFGEHRRSDGRGAKYLRGRGPLRLVFRKMIGSCGLALRVERRVKRLSKSQKERLIMRADVVARLVAQVRNKSVEPECRRNEGNDRKRMIPYGRQSIDEDDIKAVVEVLRSDWLTTGPKVVEFERTYAEYVGAKEAVAVSNGTAALHAAMYAL